MAGDAARADGHPGWFGAVMGTAPLSLAAAHAAQAWSMPWLDAVAVGFLLSASAIALWLLPRYVRRLLAPHELAAEIADPERGPLLATFPAGVLLLAGGWGLVGPHLVPTGAALAVDAVLLTVGTVVALAVGVAWADSIRQGTRDLDAVNGAWLIPAVMNMLVPLGTVPLVLAHPGAAPVLLFVAYAYFGVGLMLWLFVMPLLVARLALRPAVPSALAPTQWIPLAPAGLLGVSMLRLSDATVAIGDAGRDLQVVATVVASMGIGFALWWALFAATDLRRARRREPVPFHPGWWGFVFPVATVTLSVMTVATATGSVVLEVFGAVLGVLLLALWMLVAWRSMRLAVTAHSHG